LPKEDGALDPELRLRDVPGKSVQWLWRRGWVRLGLLGACEQPPRVVVVRIALPPSGLLLALPPCLALRLGARALASADTSVGAKPHPAEPARSGRS
jgi:hypothetical protein